MDVAKTAVRNGGKLPQRARDLPELAPAIQWMSEQSILRHGVVRSEYVSVEVVLKEAAPCADGCKSRVAIIHALMAAGWQAAASSSSSVVGKRFNQNGYLEYFCILRDHLLLAQQYDDQYVLRHSQSKGYYDALLCAFESSPDDTKPANLKFCPSCACRVHMRVECGAASSPGIVAACFRGSGTESGFLQAVAALLFRQRRVAKFDCNV